MEQDFFFFSYYMKFDTAAIIEGISYEENIAWHEFWEPVPLVLTASTAEEAIWVNGISRITMSLKGIQKALVLAWGIWLVKKNDLILQLKSLLKVRKK